MIQWVYERVSQAQGFDKIIVATDSPEIMEAVTEFGGAVKLTSPDHPSGTDRVWEVAAGEADAEYIFNIQGDEPLMNPMYLEEALGFLKNHHESVDIITLMAPVQTVREREDPNVVKVVTAQHHQALYFSRAAIPFVRDAQSPADKLRGCQRHIGVYGFRRDVLERFVQLPVSPLEQLEKLEQLRALEAGMRIYAISVPEVPIGVDTPADLALAEAKIQQLLKS